MNSIERPAKIRKLSRPDDVIESSAKTGIVPALDSFDPTVQDDAPDDNGLGDDVNRRDHSAEGLPAPEDIAPAVQGVTTSSSDPPLSKNQQKKLRRQADWDAKVDERRAIRKEKALAKRERKKAAFQAALSDPIALAQLQKPSTRAPKQLPVTIIIDCDFDDLMLDGERKSLASQITRCYSDNKNSPFRAHLTFCSFGGKLRERFDTVLDSNYKHWKGVRALDCDFVESADTAKKWMVEPRGGQLEGYFSKYAGLDSGAKQKLVEQGEVVYLTSEAEDDLEELQPYSTYIIGGLVDKNREKGICFRRATKRNVRTAKLPIGKFMDMTSRKVLATNHVNEIMLKWLECGDWGEAFMKAIPKRKGGKLKDGNDDAQTAEDEAKEEGEEGGSEHTVE